LLRNDGERGFSNAEMRSRTGDGSDFGDEPCGKGMAIGVTVKRLFPGDLFVGLPTGLLVFERMRCACEIAYPTRVLLTMMVIDL
jgi:hypothetical protein